MKKSFPLTIAQQRAARAETVVVAEAEPYGWVAFTEQTDERRSGEVYHLHCEPQTRRLVCTCADFIFRGGDDAQFECKHVFATLKFIAREFLAYDYELPSQIVGARLAA